jgi:hypothetical protein
MRSNGDWLFKVVPFFIAGVFVLIVCVWIGIGFLGVKAAGALKDCTPALTSKNVGGEQQYSVKCRPDQDAP